MAYYVLLMEPTVTTVSSHQPLRSLTRAIELIVEAHGDRVDPPETEHLAAGTYSDEFGEIFPIIVPANVEVRGESHGSTTIEYLLTSGVNVCVNLRGSLFDIAIEPVNPDDVCIRSLMSNHEDVVFQQVAIYTGCFSNGIFSSMR